MMEKSGKKWGVVAKKGGFLPQMMNSVIPSRHAYLGDYPHALDAKRRITIPARWRRSDADEFYLMPSDQLPCILALMPEEFDRIVANALERIPIERQSDFLRIFGSRIQQGTADKQGRLIIPEAFCKKAGLGSDVLLVGAVSRIEIWNPDTWSEFNASREVQYIADSKAAGVP